jgi:hypothetical protein
MTDTVTNVDPRGASRPRSIDDLATWLRIERVVLEIRSEIAAICHKMADQDGEPPLDQLGLME